MNLFPEIQYGSPRLLERPGTQAAVRLRVAARIGIGALVAAAVGLAGCGIPARPMPPSLLLPKPVHDLTAGRVGDAVALHFTAPEETTDGLRLRKPVELKILRGEPNGTSQTAATISVPPGESEVVQDSLSGALARNSLRPIDYKVLALNRDGRDAGPSNLAATLAGTAPSPVSDLSAATVENGVLLHWRPIKTSPPNTSVLLRRTTIGANSGAAHGSSATSSPVEQTLRVRTPGGGWAAGAALDRSAVLGQSYEYRAVRVTEVQSGSLLLQAESTPSAPVTIATRDTFPPAVPEGLVAIPVSAANNRSPEIDLSWLANTEPDLAGYFVDRRYIDEGENAQWVRIAPAKGSPPLPVPAYRDLDVQVGRTYMYSIRAVDHAGNVSARSTEITSTVPSH
jgi:hypothetical protein